MGPGTGRYRNNQTSFGQQPPYQHSQQPPHLLFMAGGSVRFPQMSRGFSMMPNGGSLNPGVMHCNMQHGFNGGGGYGGNNGYGYGYPANSAPIFQHHYHYQHQQQQQQPQPQIIHHIPPQHFVQQAYISPPPQSPVTSTTQRSGFIDGIKNMVKGFIQPLSCEVYSDNHKYYNPKFRNNYMRDITSEIAYPQHYQQKQQSEPHVQAVMIGLEFGIPQVKSQEKKSTIVMTEKPINLRESSETAVPSPSSSSPRATDVVAIFTSEDFPELPAPRRNRSMTPAKTEETIPKPAVMETKKEEITEQQSSPPPPHCSEESTKQQPTPKSICFEIKCTTAPCGRRPTFGGRLKVVPPPFSFNKCFQACRRRNCQNTTPHDDCDTEEDNFVLFPTCRPPRQRQISECSDDSFVVFFTEDEDGLVAIDSDIDDDEEDDEDDDDDDEDVDSDDSLDTDEEEDEPEDRDSVAESDDELDNGTDVVDSSFLGRNKTDRNKCTGTTLLYPEVDCDGAEHEQFDSGFDVKKVSFNPNPPVVHVIHAWNFAYRAARKGHWEDFARDRTRFQKRIERTSFYLNPILTPEHREKIYRSRFSEESNKQPSQLLQQSSLSKLTTRSPQTTADSNSEDNKNLPKLTESLRCARF